jgi:hypothetical protein
MGLGGAAGVHGGHRNAPVLPRKNGKKRGVGERIERALAEHGFVVLLQRWAICSATNRRELSFQWILERAKWLAQMVERLPHMTILACPTSSSDGERHGSNPHQ